MAKASHDVTRIERRHHASPALNLHKASTRRVSIRPPSYHAPPSSLHRRASRLVTTIFTFTRPAPTCQGAEALRDKPLAEVDR